MDEILQQLSEHYPDIYCVQCDKDVRPQRLFGYAVYPHREDLRDKVFYQCPICGNYVGTHRDGRPLGTIPTAPLRKARNRVHKIIDQYWLPTKDRKKRKELYVALSRFLGREYHTGELNSLCECDKVINYYLNNYGNNIVSASQKGVVRND